MPPTPPRKRTPNRCAFFVWTLVLGAALPAWSAAPNCEVRSGALRTPVIELYTSEGCSACPPADQWLSTLKGQPVVAQAFHVGYWDYIGWADRFASAAHTARQRERASANRLNSVYTPQLLRNGRDWRDWRGSTAGQASAPAQVPARAAITLQRIAQTDRYTARVTPAEGVSEWSAYWTVTEDGHTSRVQSGENRGEFLQHDFVVRQYVPVGRYQGSQPLNFAAIAAQPGHAQHINLVVSDPQSGEPLQAVSLQCDAAP